MVDKRLRIPNVDVHLDLEEAEVTQTRLFQRLYLIRQLGLAYLVYPAASHTRGAHSIETLFEAGKILDALAVDHESSDAKDVRMAALLHDIGHIPFSHTLEDEHPILPRHDKARYAQVLDQMLPLLSPRAAARVDSARSILDALGGRVKPDWRADLIGNTLCADLLAYISSDAAWTGIEKRAGVYRVYDYFERVPDSTGVNRLCTRLTKGGLRTDIVSAIVDLLDMRYALTERVVYHHAKCVASAMLARAATLRHLHEDNLLLDVGDESFLRLLESPESPLGGDSEEREASKRLVGALLSRRLYKRMFKLTASQCDDWDRSHQTGGGESSFCVIWRDPSRVEASLRRVEELHSLPLGSLALWCPERKGGMKLAETLVTWETTEGRHHPTMLRSEEVKATFPGVHQRVSGIEQQYLDLWALWIGIDRLYLDRTFAVQKSLENEFQATCDSIFGDTYLAKDPELVAARERSKHIERAFGDLRPQVDVALADQAARGGVETLAQDGRDRLAVMKAIEASAKATAGTEEETKETKKQRRL